MPTSSPDDASTPSSSKKRKSDGSDSERPAKQSRKISSYFSQLYPVSSNSKESESQPVPLNDEQKRVLEMVVDEGKNVFFTGAAGMWFVHVHNLPFTSRSLSPISCLFVVQEPENRCCSELLSRLSRRNTQRNRLSFL